MNKTILALSVAIGVALAGAAHSAEIVPVILDGDNEGYNDPKPATTAAPGNPGKTVGEQRRIVAQFAADLWGSVLQSNVPIYIGAQFNPLGANVLGSAGASFVFSDEPEFPVQGVWYSSALADALTGRELNEGFTDIGSQFSSDFNFYYGLDGNTPAGMVNFLDVVMHEYGHGLGVQNFANEAAGTFLNNTPDIYSTFTFDNTKGEFWSTMNKNERKASAINYGNVVWTGNSATHGAALILDDRGTFRVTAPASIAGSYEYGTASFGPALSTANFTGSVVVGVDAANTAGPSTTDACSPITNPVAGKIVVVDRGTCGFVVKAINVQNAGGKGMIVADNVPGTPPPGLGGVDPNITIPAIRVTQADGAKIKGATGVQVTFLVDATKLQGADDNGRPRLYMPNPVVPGSSGSHYDTALAPNALMEPSINDSLNAAVNIDISGNLLEDTGWKLNGGTAKVGDCDTGIDIVNDAGIIIGANVEASSNLCEAGSANHGGYQSCMAAYTTRMRNAGLLTSAQSDRVMACAEQQN